MKDKNNTKEKKRFPPFRLLLAWNIVPVLLSTAVMSATTYIYVNSSGAAVLLYTLMSFAFSAVTYYIYEVLRWYGKTWLTTIFVIVFMNVCLIAGFRSIDSFGAFTQWFMEPSVFTSLYYGRTTAVMLMIGMILISCMYYFTRVRYRGVFVFLICLCPFCLFAKTFTAIPVIYPIIIMTLFFLLMTGRVTNTAADDEPVRTIKVGTAGRYMTLGAFLLIVTVIASFMPKLEFAPYREQFDEFVTGVTISAAEAMADFNDFNDSSSNATSNDDTTIIFYFRGNNPELLKRQSFNFYDSSEHLWKYDLDDPDNGYSNWAGFTAFEDPTALYEAAGFDGGDTAERSCWISPADGTVRAVYVPQDLTGLTVYNNPDVKFYRTENDEYFITSADSPNVRAYQIRWAEFTQDPTFSEMFTDELAEELSAASDAAYSYLRAKDQANRYYGSEYYGDSLEEPYSSRSAHEQVKALTEEIIADCANDYEKAKAIEQFFLKGDYIYDLNFTTPDPSPDYFILRSKRGACAPYATAMTLMCREAGLTVRYCEGFWIQRGNGDGTWYVTTADSHSYVQVWLDGYGWTNFNPTSSVTDGGYVDPTFMIVGFTAAVIVLLGITALILRPVIRERRFVRRTAKARGAAQYSLIYGKINDMVNTYEGSKINTYTPTETAERCGELFGYDISGFVEQYERAVYGGADDGGDLSAVYTGFAAAYKEKRKNDRKNRNNKQ